MQEIILSLIVIPLLTGAVVLCLPSEMSEKESISYASVIILGILAVLAVMILLLYGRTDGNVNDFIQFSLTEELDITLRPDDLSIFFIGFIPAIWFLGGIFSLEYLKHESNKKRFWGFYLLTLGALHGLSFSGNLITMYLFFEMMTLVSMPLVFHTQSHKAIMAGLKYLLYSMCGAYMALFGVFFLYQTGNTMEFIPGGVISMEMLGEAGVLVRISVFLMILGFGVKAGMFPMHAWLPTAHPVAPAPASAVLSAVIVKGGILAVLRSVYYIVGVDIIRGTWVQQTWIVLVLITVFMGSMLAFREPVFKKRLAYSSVSQESYILLGMAVLNPAALTGALMHVLFHALIKTALFLCAGAVIYQTGCTRADELTGIGKKMPVTIWCYTFVSLGLIGIPPMNGFISKWYLMTGMLWSGEGVISWMGPAVLLVSALLTAGYLLPVTIQGFLPGTDYDYGKLKNMEPAKKMTVPIIILASAALITGLFPGRLAQYLETIAEAVL